MRDTAQPRLFALATSFAAAAALSVVSPLQQPASAQGVPLAPGILVRLGAGAGSGGTTVSDRSDDSWGVIGTLGAGLSTGSLRWLVEAEGQAFEVQNPVQDESFRAIYALASLQVGLLGLYVRPGVGVGALFFEGEDVAEDSDLGLAAGVSAGYEIPLTGLAVEGIARWTSTSDGELDARLYGVQLVKTWTF